MNFLKCFSMDSFVLVEPVANGCIFLAIHIDDSLLIVNGRDEISLVRSHFKINLFSRIWESKLIFGY